MNQLANLIAPGHGVISGGGAVSYRLGVPGFVFFDLIGMMT
jgi:hypothetical protein